MLNGADGIEVVGAATDGDEAVEMATTQAPDVVLMDLSMPEVGGIEATRRIKELLPDVRVVVLTSFSDREMVLDALDAGASGYVLKDADPDELLRYIRQAAQGLAALDPRAQTAVLESRTESRPKFNLTERERAVVALVADGLPNKEIARRLAISEATVKS